MVNGRIFTTALIYFIKRILLHLFRASYIINCFKYTHSSFSYMYIIAILKIMLS